MNHCLWECITYPSCSHRLIDAVAFYTADISAIFLLGFKFYCVQREILRSPGEYLFAISYVF